MSRAKKKNNQKNTFEYLRPPPPVRGERVRASTGGFQKREKKFLKQRKMGNRKSQLWWMCVRLRFGLLEWGLGRDRGGGGRQHGSCTHYSTTLGHEKKKQAKSSSRNVGWRVGWIALLLAPKNQKNQKKKKKKIKKKNIHKNVQNFGLT